MGLVIFAAIGLYFLLSIGVVIGAVSYARRGGKSVPRWGWGAAFVMYLFPFWDWIPTLISHEYHCTREAGFWIYKTPEQWAKENPGAMETLIDNSPSKYPNWPSENWKGNSISSVNQRFGILSKSHLYNSNEGELFINVWRWQSEFLDKRTGEVLARQVNFSSGNNGYMGNVHSMRFWLESGHCRNHVEKVREFKEFIEQLRGAKK